MSIAAKGVNFKKSCVLKHKESHVDKASNRLITDANNRQTACNTFPKQQLTDKSNRDFLSTQERKNKGKLWVE